MRKITVMFMAVALAWAVVVYVDKEETKAAPSQPNPIGEITKSIELGKALFMDPKLGTNGKTCNTCHAMGGTTDMAMENMKIKAFDNLAQKYPKYFMMAGRVMTLDQVVNFCIVTPLKGKALACDSQELTDLVAYCASVKPAKMKGKTK